MTRKISLLTAVTAAAVTLGVPAAYGEGNPAGAPASATSEEQRSTLIGPRAAYERAVAEGHLGLSTFRNAFEPAVPLAAAAKVTTVDSGSGTEWSELGIGFGLGIVLAVALILVVRVARSRQLAHR